MTLLVGHHLPKPHFQSLLVSVHQPRTHLLSAALSSHLVTEIIMTMHGYLPTDLASNVGNWLIGNIGTEIKIKSETEMGLEIGEGLEMGNITEIGVGTETEIGVGTETEGTITMKDLVNLVEGIKIRPAAVMVVGIMVKVLIEAEEAVVVGAGVMVFRQKAFADRFQSQHKDKGEVRTSASSNLVKLKDLYGDLSTLKDEPENRNPSNRINGPQEVIRLGGSTWK